MEAGAVLAPASKITRKKGPLFSIYFSHQGGVSASQAKQKHRWVRHISSSARRLRDMHLSTTFVEHSLRPSLARRTPFAAQASDDEAYGEEEGAEAEEAAGEGASDGAQCGSSEATFVTLGAPSAAGSSSMPALHG